MKKNQFFILVVTVIASLIFSLGMCMCLLPEWNAFKLGIIFTAIGGVILICLGLFFWIKNKKNRKPINWKLVGKIAYGVVSVLIFGLGMSMIMVLDLIIWGIVVGVVGLVLSLFLIPMFLGFKN